MQMTPVKGLGLSLQSRQRRNGESETFSCYAFREIAPYCIGPGLASSPRRRRLRLHALQRWDILWLERCAPESAFVNSMFSCSESFQLFAVGHGTSQWTVIDLMRFAVLQASLTIKHE
jgi:hypothetical protein